MTIDGRFRRSDQPANAAAETVPQRTLEAKRLRAILYRLASDYYEGAEAQARVAAAVERELNGADASGAPRPPTPG